MVIAALLLGLTASIAYLSLRFGLERHKTPAVRPALRVAGRDA
jgi:hypothetical protein